MYERMLNKAVQPEIQEIREYIGEKSWTFTERFEELMQVRYNGANSLEKTLSLRK